MKVQEVIAKYGKIVSSEFQGNSGGNLDPDSTAISQHWKQKTEKGFTLYVSDNPYILLGVDNPSGQSIYEKGKIVEARQVWGPHWNYYDEDGHYVVGGPGDPHAKFPGIRLIPCEE